MSNADKRAVHTDALDSLGTIITENEKRDAIHLAVEPVIAGQTLKPGQDVGFLPDGTVGVCKRDELLGIVDPFLPQPIHKGDRFWLVVYPRQITSLRHVWTHPAFDEEKGQEDQTKAKAVIRGGANYAAKPLTQVEKSKRWIEEFAANLDFTYNRLMTAASEWLDDGRYTYDNEMLYKQYGDEFPAFWVHYEIVTGEAVANKDRQSFFSCSC